MGVVKNQTVRVGADMSGLVGGFKKATDSTGNFKKQASRDIQSVASELAHAESAFAAIRDAAGDMDLSTSVAKQISATNKEIGSLQKQAETLESSIAHWSTIEPEGMQYKTQELKDQLAQVDTQTDGLLAKLARLENVQSVADSFDFKEVSFASLNQLQTGIAEARDYLSFAQQAAERLDEPLAAAAGQSQTLGDELAQAKAHLKELESQGFNVGSAEWDEAYQDVSRLTDAVSSYKASLTGGEKETLKTVRAVNKMATVAKKSGSWAQKLKSFFSGIGKQAKSASPGIGDLMRSMRKMGAVAVGLKLGKAIFGELSSIVKSYISQNEALQNKIETLKGALGQALAPAINVVANALDKVMPLVLGLSNAISGLITNLFGSGWTTLAEGAAGAADATKGATDAQKEYNRTLAGFDKITKLSESKGDSEAGSSAATVAPKEIALPKWLTDLPGAIKNAFSSDGLKGVGQALASAVNEAIGGIDLGNVGTTVGTWVQEAVSGIGGFVDELDWAGIGQKINTYFKGLFGSIDLQSVISTAGSLLGGGLTLVWEAVGSDLWQGLTDGIAEAKQFFADEIEAAGGNVVEGIWNGITKAISSVGQWLKKNVGEPFMKGLGKTFNIEKAKEIGKNIFGGIKTGLKNAISAIGKWIKDTIFTPLVTAFKQVFGIHSPSKDEQIVGIGTNIVAGVLNGMVAGLKSIGTWVKDKIYTPMVTAFDSVFGEEGFFSGLLKNSLKDSGQLSVDFKAKLTSWKDTLKDKSLDFKAKIKKGWTGTLAKALGIDAVTSKLDLKLPKISIDWNTVSVFGKDFKYPAGFDIKWNAMGAILNGAQIFGRVGNTFLGGGEAGREALLPLDRNTGWMDKIADRVAKRVGTTGSGAQSLTIYLTLDGKVVSRTVVKHINAEAQATGVNPLAAHL